MKIISFYLTIFIVLSPTIQIHSQKNISDVVEEMYKEYAQDYESKLIFEFGERNYFFSDTIPESEKGKIKVLTVDKRPDCTEITDLQEFVNLEALTIRGKFNSLPLEIGQLKKLRQLTLVDINALNLEEFFKFLNQLPELKELYLYDLKLSELPPSFYELSGIEKLRIYDCIHLATVSDKISNLKNLFYFEIWNTSVTEFPKICTSNLKSLIIGKNGNMKMPMFDSKFNNIEYLVISNMDLSRKTIKEISRIKSLRTIKLFNCNLTRFPYCFSKCPNLVLLMLSGNNIKRITKSLKNFKSLEKLDLDLNPIALRLNKMLNLNSKYEFSIIFSLTPKELFDADNNIK